MIDFEWFRDDAGYELRPQEDVLKLQTPPREGETLIAAAPEIYLAPRRPHRIVRRGGRLTPYRPIDRFNSLFKQFARDGRTPDGVLKFVEKFGPLTKLGLDDLTDGENVEAMIAHADAMHSLLDAYERNGKSDLQRALGPKGKCIFKSPLSEIKATLIFDPADDGPRLAFTFSTLLSAIWFQLGQCLTRRDQLHTCQHCGEFFEVGIGTRRRLDAKFCSDQHRVAFNSQKRTKEKPHA